jgi:uncharacterized protein YsxB (DUF464 family)
MVTVKKKGNSLIISGHANFAEYGKDIVCASLSSIITTSVNDMMIVKEKALTYSDDEKEIVIKLVEEDELVLKLFNNLVLLLESLAKDYPKNIKIESEE